MGIRTLVIPTDAVSSERRHLSAGHSMLEVEGIQSAG